MIPAAIVEALLDVLSSYMNSQTNLRLPDQGREDEFIASITDQIAGKRITQICNLAKAARQKYLSKVLYFEQIQKLIDDISESMVTQGVNALPFLAQSAVNFFVDVGSSLKKKMQAALNNAKRDFDKILEESIAKETKASRVEGKREEFKEVIYNYGRAVYAQRVYLTYVKYLSEVEKNGQQEGKELSQWQEPVELLEICPNINITELDDEVDVVKKIVIKEEKMTTLRSICSDERQNLLGQKMLCAAYIRKKDYFEGENGYLTQLISILERQNKYLEEIIQSKMIRKTGKEKEEEPAKINLEEKEEPAKINLDLIKEQLTFIQIEPSQGWHHTNACAIREKDEQIKALNLENQRLKEEQKELNKKLEKALHKAREKGKELAVLLPFKERVGVLE